MSKIKWWKYVGILRQVLGQSRFSKIQLYAKFFQIFIKDYGWFKPRTKFDKQTYVFIIDGKTIHGGLSDRLRGLFSVYAYCKKNNNDFKIYWKYPFCLEDYLQPNKVDWLIYDNKPLSYNLNDVDFKFFNSYCELNGKSEEYFDLLKSRKKEIHVYTNVTIEENRYASFFEELFIPTKPLKDAVAKCKNEIGGDYISVTYRFIGILGDFVDDERFKKKQDDMDVDLYIQKSISFIEKLHIDYSHYKILVTADSNLFLSKLKNIPYVYTIPGRLEHMDRTKNTDFNVHLKPFVDFLMISSAYKCFTYSVGNMFKGTKFAKTAALIGGRELKEINE